MADENLQFLLTRRAGYAQGVARAKSQMERARNSLEEQESLLRSADALLADERKRLGLSPVVQSSPQATSVSETLGDKMLNPTKAAWQYILANPEREWTGPDISNYLKPLAEAGKLKTKSKSWESVGHYILHGLESRGKIEYIPGSVNPKRFKLKDSGGNTLV